MGQLQATETPLPAFIATDRAACSLAARFFPLESLLVTATAALPSVSSLFLPLSFPCLYYSTADFGLTVETAKSLRRTAENWVHNSRSAGTVRTLGFDDARESVAPLVPLNGQSVRGTGAWMAPEIVTRQVEVTTKADVYSFGVVLWELVSPNQDLLVAWVSTSAVQRSLHYGHQSTA